MFEQLQNSNIETIEVILNGQSIQVQQGMSVAAMVLTQGLRYTRSTPNSESKRAPFCMMGVCFECLMVIDGKANQRACTTYVKQGMMIETQLGTGPAIGDIR